MAPRPALVLIGSVLMPDPFTYSSDEVLLETPIFRLHKRRGSHPTNGHTGDYFILENPDWVNMVALTDEEQIVLVRQWRHGVAAVELEIPAGMVDKGEGPLEAAARELREETGYAARSMHLLGKVAPNAAYQSNTCHTVLAEGCSRLHETDFDPGEDIELVLVPLAELPALVRSGQLSNGMVIAALFWWLERTGKVAW
jgi:ADP-ribose pyrophosphatase